MDPELDSINLWSFQKLTWNNYYTWSKHMKTALEAHQLWWGYVERERPPPKKPPVEPPRPGLSASLDPATPNRPPVESQASSRHATAVTDAAGKAGEAKATSLSDDEDFYMCSSAYIIWKRRWDRYRDWVRNDRAAMGLMKCALDPSQWPYVQPATTSKEMWDTLYQLYFVPRRATDLHFHMWDLWHQSWDEHTTSMAQHINHMFDLRRRVIDYGGKLDDDILIHAILKTLPLTPNWRLLRFALFQKGDTLTITDVITELNDEFNRMQDEVGNGRGKRGTGEKVAQSGQGREQGVGGGAKKRGRKSRGNPK